MSPGIIAAIVGGVLLLLLICCGGGILLVASSDDDEQASPTTTSETSQETTEETSEPTTETETETDTASPTTPPTPTSPPGGSTSVSFPDSFDGWSKQDSSVSSVATYRKDGNTLSAIASSGDQVDSYERIWEDVTTHGDISCGSLSSSSYVQCAGARDGDTVLITAVSGTPDETASTLQSLLDAI